MSAELFKRKLLSESYHSKTSDSRKESQKRKREREELIAAKKFALGATRLKRGIGENWIKTLRSVMLLAMILPK